MRPPAIMQEPLLPRLGDVWRLLEGLHCTHSPPGDGAFACFSLVYKYFAEGPRVGHGALPGVVYGRLLTPPGGEALVMVCFGNS